MAIFRHHGQLLHYLIRGSGEPVPLIHGIGSSGADWAFQVSPLEARFRVIVPDLPGCGHSATPRGGFSIPLLAASLWALLDELGASESNIVGRFLAGWCGRPRNGAAAAGIGTTTDPHQ